MAPKHRLYTPEIAETILERLSDGESLTAICRDEGMPSRGAVQHWIINDHDGFAGRYAHAREAGLAIMAEQTLAIADDGSNDTYTTADGEQRVDVDVVQRSKLRVDTRKWILSKLMPKTYGDKLELSGEIGVKEIPDDNLESRLVILLRATGVIGAPGGEAEATIEAEDRHLLPGKGASET